MKTCASGLRSMVSGVVALWLVQGTFAADPPVVYVARDFRDSSGEGPVVRAKSGALRLATFDPARQTWTAVDLVNAAASPGQEAVPVDVADPDVSHDGQRIAFAGYSAAQSAWRIFEVNADGTGLRQVTTSDRRLDLTRYGEAAQRFESYDDTDPCYLPDGRICFVSTRYPGFAPGNRRVATNLYVVNADGTDTHRITSERFGADTPAIEPSTGQIVYSRWWLTPRETPIPSGGPTPNRPPVYYGPVTNPNNFSSIVLRGIDDSAYTGVNSWFLTSINPDGGAMSQRTGYGLNRELTMAYRPAFLADGTLIAQFITESPVLGQASRNGVRRLPAAGLTDLPVAIGGPQAFDGNGLIQNPNPGAPITQRLEPAFFYHSAVDYTDGRLLISGHFAGASGAYGIHLQTPGERPRKVIDEAGFAELDAVALAPRTLPPVIADRAPRLESELAPRTVEEAKALYGTFTFRVENIFGNAPVDSRIAHAPPIGRDLTIEFYMHPQREGTQTPDAPILVGAKSIPPDGRVEMELPAGVPLFEVLRRADDKLAVGRDGQAFHVGGMNFGVQGAVARCVGCHAGHSQQAVPDGEAVRWTNIAASAVVTASSVRGRSSGGGLVFAPDLLVDRLTDPLASEWAAEDTGRPVEVRLRWPQPIVASQVKLHGTKRSTQGVMGPRDQVISAVTLTQYVGEDRVAEPRRVEARIEETGTTLSLDSTLIFDILTITIDPGDVTGIYEGLSGAALAEVEVIGRGAGASEATVVVVEGDINCDARVNVSDPIALLDSLFRSGGSLCCDTAADVNADLAVNLSDTIYLLRYLFQGGDPLSLECARKPGSPLFCEQESCP